MSYRQVAIAFAAKRSCAVVVARHRMVADAIVHVGIELTIGFMKSARRR